MLNNQEDLIEQDLNVPLRSKRILLPIIRQSIVERNTKFIQPRNYPQIIETEHIPSSKGEDAMSFHQAPLQVPINVAEFSGLGQVPSFWDSITSKVIQPVAEAYAQYRIAKLQRSSQAQPPPPRQIAYGVSDISQYLPYIVLFGAGLAAIMYFRKK